jgi:hypothetical protein
MKIEPKTRKINNISELGIGDVVCSDSGFPMVVVGLWAEPEEYNSHIPDNTGQVICDFDGNEGDVFEYELDKQSVYIIENAADLTLEDWQESGDIIEDLTVPEV